MSTSRSIWGDGEESWIRADVLRIQHPYPLINYTVKQKLTKEPGWEWTRDFFKDDDRIAAMVKAYKSSVNGTKFMFSVEIPKNVKRALEMDKDNENNLWQESIDKEIEMINQFHTFQRLDKGEKLPLSSNWSLISLSLPTSVMDNAWPASLQTETRLLLTMKMYILK
jgi:hypothetical protein